MKCLLFIFVIFACCSPSKMLFGAHLDRIEYEWQGVGNLGNAQNQNIRLGGQRGFGRVDYKYRMAKRQVTNAQYATFLNAVARVDDPGNLYHVGMRFPQGGINKSGDKGNFQYVPKPGWKNKPVNYVNVYDSMRYANWINNGQPVGRQGLGTTESGSYTITALGIELNDITRNDGPGVFLPTEDEWFKAAYYEPGASTDGYWTYPTRSDIPPRHGVLLGNGDMVPGRNIANFDSRGVLANVGTAGPESDSYYGISGMAGSLWEWTESLIIQGEFAGAPSSNPPRNGKWRAIMGGSRSSNPGHMNAIFRHPEDPHDGDCCRGIRLVAIGVPEPSLWTFTAVATLAISAGRRRRTGNGCRHQSQNHRSQKCVS